MTPIGPSRAAAARPLLRLRLAIGAVGVLGGAFGLTLFLGGVPVAQWPRVGMWLVAGVAVHDAVLAPVAVILGLLVLRRAPVRTRPALRVALLGLASVVLIGLPLLVTR